MFFHGASKDILNRSIHGEDILEARPVGARTHRENFRETLILLNVVQKAEFTNPYLDKDDFIMIDANQQAALCRLSFPKMVPVCGLTKLDRRSEKIRL